MLLPIHLPNESLLLVLINHFNDLLKTPPRLSGKKSKSVRDGIYIFYGFKNMGYLRLFNQVPEVIDSGKSVFE
jgi:hypothetical protein